MPIYEYQCNGCNKEFEELVLSKDEVICCPDCGGSKVSRLMSVCAYRSSRDGGGETFKSSASSACSGCTATSCASCK